MANKATGDIDNVAPTPAAISAALHSNLALQSELKSRLLDVRKLQSRNRHDATEVLSSLSLVWGNDADTITTMEKGTEIPLDFLTKKFADDTHHECSSSAGLRSLLPNLAPRPEREQQRGGRRA